MCECVCVYLCECECVPALNPLLGVPSPCWDPVDALGLFGEPKELQVGQEEPCAPLLVGLLWRAGHEHRPPAQVCDQGKKEGEGNGKKRRRKWKEKEKEMERKGKEPFMVSLRASRAPSLCGAARPCHLTQQPLAHSQAPLSRYW